MPQGLLGQYDPRAMQRSALSRGLLGAGIGLLSQQPSRTPIGFGQSMGAGLAGLAGGIDQGRADYFSMLNADRENMQWQEQQKQKAAEDKAFDAFLSDPKIPADVKNFAQINRPEAMKYWMELQHSKPDAPSSYGEFSLAQQNPAYAGFLDKKSRSGRPQNFGTIPPGMVLKGSEETGYYYEPIPGSKEAQQQTQMQDAAQQEATAADVVVQDIDRSLDTIGQYPGRTTGPGGAVFKSVPGTRAHNVKALIDTVKANAGFDRLQRMRESSPTGGALGQVSEREIAYLQATIGNLEQTQDDKQLADNLKRVKNAYLDIIHGQGQGPAREELGFQQQDSDYTQEDLEFTARKHGMTVEEVKKLLGRK